VKKSRGVEQETRKPPLGTGRVPRPSKLGTRHGPVLGEGEKKGNDEKEKGDQTVKHLGTKGTIRPDSKKSKAMPTPLATSLGAHWKRKESEKQYREPEK